MYSSIVVPLDGSPLSEYALSVACGQARRSGATLHLVHVHQMYTPAPIYVDEVPVIDDNLHSLWRAHAHAYLEHIRDRLNTESFPITVTVLYPDDGGPEQSVPAVLAAHAADTAADVIVMTTHGRSGLARSWLGSVADALVLVSPVPVLSLRPDQPVLAAEQPAEFRHILIPLDGSARAEEILEAALAPGDRTYTEYTLLRVVQPFDLPGFAPHVQATRLDVTTTQEAIADAQRYLDRVAQRLRATGYQIHTQAYLADQPAGAILDVARERRADLIALATHGRTGLTRLLLGSVADKVRRGAEVPVLLYRSKLPDEVAGRRTTDAAADTALPQRPLMRDVPAGNCSG